MRSVVPAIAALVCAGSALGQEATSFSQPYWIDKPVIEAIGRAELQVDPNRSNFSVGFKNTARTSAEATRLATARAKRAYQAMEGVAGDDLTIESRVSVSAIYNQVEDDEGNLVTDYSADNIRAYEASVLYSVGVKDLSKASRTRAAALAVGPETSSYFNNSLQRDTDILQAAYRAAIVDARERAQLMAEAAGVSLGRLLVVQEGSGPCLGEWSGSVGATSYMRSSSPPPPPPPPPPPSPGSESITADDLDALELPNTPDKVGISAQACLVYEIRQ
ncbi:SIMPL domain-containing protein [Henriciella marina]|uniref:SIMPL domain-containing protein n=1 Tax=Henriciella marina TaxID=453851 RepID=UPI00039FE691|nr:SIMPL domain-containing protein [Henriciella marina]